MPDPGLILILGPAGLTALIGAVVLIVRRRRRPGPPRRESPR